jgi:hypothetical protein
MMGLQTLTGRFLARVMPMRSPLSWLLVPLAVLASLLATSIGLGLAHRLWAVLGGPWAGMGASLDSLLGSALIVVALAAVLVLLNLDDSPPTPSRGDLDRLAGAKQRLGAVRRSRRVRDAAARARRGAPGTFWSAETYLVAPAPPEDVLEKLLQRKHDGAWH